MDFTGNGTDGSGSGSSSSNGTSDDHTRSIQRALASLQLPHMPLDSDLGEEDADGSTLPIQTFRILVVADVDLSSTSALAEYTLQQKNQVFDASRIDLCIACGPFCRDQDLLPYLRGKQKAARQNLHASQSKSSETANTPFFRSQEETVALEGLMTAALSQLESIVCRVVYCPGSSDPLTTLLSAKRLTPNSRNVHRQWLPMVPGLGCAALFYLDAPQILMPKKSSSKGDGGDGGGGQSYEDQDEDPQDTSENDEEDTMALLTEQLIGIQQRYVFSLIGVERMKGTRSNRKAFEVATCCALPVYCSLTCLSYRYRCCCHNSLPSSPLIQSLACQFRRIQLDTPTTLTTRSKTKTITNTLGCRLSFSTRTDCARNTLCTRSCTDSADRRNPGRFGACK